VLQILEQRCIHCRLCEKTCLNKSMQFITTPSGQLERRFNAATCWECGVCADACPKDVLSVVDGVGQAAPVEDCDQIPGAQLPPVREIEAQVQIVTRVAASTYFLRIGWDMKRFKEFSFLPGQFVDLYFDSFTARAYSIASSPFQRDFLEFFISTAQHGFGAECVKSLVVGEKISFSGPFGILLPVNPPKFPRKVFIAAGTGVAPLRSMLYYFLAARVASEAVLFHAMKDGSELFLYDEFLALVRADKRFQYVVAMLDFPKTWPHGREGLDAALLKEKTRLLQSEIYLCGGPGFTQSTVDKLIGFGVQQSNIFYEHYH